MMMTQLSDVGTLRQILKQGGMAGKSAPLSESTQEGILSFYEIMLKENQIQNLTRLVSPQDFYDYHLADTLKLLETEGLIYPALDLGSGAGIPGILAALVDGKKWILAESEKRKAEYLQRAVDILKIRENVQVVPDRAEAFLRTHQVGSVVARAVGTVEKIYGWIRKCSTWNNLILLKGPNWEEEWKLFQTTPFGLELKILGDIHYQVGSEQKSRRIIKLERRVKGFKG